MRYLPDHEAPATARQLFGETVLPVASPAYLKRSAKPLVSPADLEHHVLLLYEDEELRRPFQSWSAWLEMAGVANLRPAGSIGFNQNEAAMRAALDGQGLALATLALVENLLQDGRLVAPLPQRFSYPRSYYLVRPQRATTLPAVAAFCQWLADQVGQQAGAV